VGVEAGRLDRSEAKSFAESLRSAPSVVSAAIEASDPVATALSATLGGPSLYILGRGLGHAIAKEGSLKVKEIAYLHAEAYPAGESKHGPIALVEPGFPVFIVEEYSNPRVGGLRRFFYQGISCRHDGPKIRLLRIDGREIAVEDPIVEAARLIDTGHIVAVKGVGGYHIFADAQRDDVVAELRRRKKRPSQPFAVMALDLDVAKALVELDEKAAELLTSPQRPIVLLPKREDSPVSPLVSPGLDKEGVFLPYTALQYLLLSQTRGKFAIATSGNVHGEPMCTELSCVFSRLGKVVDYVLDHDLEIVHGPIALVEPGFPVFIVATSDAPEVAGNAIEMAARGGRVFVVRPADLTLELSSKAGQISQVTLPPSGGILELEPFILTPIFQLLSYRIAVRRGYNPDKPRNLAKTVTVE